jgi:hypothetical protein
MGRLKREDQALLQARKQEEKKRKEKKWKKTKYNIIKPKPE